MNSKSMAGWIGFAGIIMLVVGTMDFFEGLIALFRDNYYVVTGSSFLVVQEPASQSPARVGVDSRRRGRVRRARDGQRGCVAVRVGPAGEPAKLRARPHWARVEPVVDVTLGRGHEIAAVPR